MKRSKEQLLSAIEVQKKLQIETDKCNYHKFFPNEAEAREITRLNMMILFHDLGVDYEEGPVGFIKIKREVGGDILYALRTGKWKVEGRKVWYRSGKLSVKQFVEKYVLTNQSK